MDASFADKVRASKIENVEEKKKNKRRMVFVVIGIVIVSIAMAAYIYDKYGTVYLKPGEKYTVNIPVLGPGDVPVICGKAVYGNGSPAEGIRVNVTHHKKKDVLAWNVTNNDGIYCVYLPLTKKSMKYDVYVGYDNATTTLGSNKYSLDLKTDKKKYSKAKGEVVNITGTIENEDAEIENGRIEIDLRHRDKNGRWKKIFSEKYYVNIESKEEYKVPSDEFNFSWKITNDTAIGEYKIYIKTSFNAKERKKTLKFNVTA